MPTDPGVYVLTWDWREQIDLLALHNILRDMAGADIRLYRIDTGSDQYAIVLADRDMTDAEARAAWRRTWDEEATDER